MRKTLTILGLVAAGLYVLLHGVLASSFVQKRVLEELQKSLSLYGVDLEIESIEFSAFSPRIYLNRVQIRTTPKCELQLDHPLNIDKIKIEFQPLALLYRQIVISEVALYHPSINIPRADRLYQRITRLLGTKNKLVVKGPAWPLVFKRVGMVDAEFSVESSDPPFSVLSSSLTLFLTQSASGQQTVSAESPNLTFRRQKLEVKFSKIDLDLDFTDKSLRANRCNLEGEGLKVDLKGATSLPLSFSKSGDAFHLSHSIDIDLNLLNAIQDLALPKLKGRLVSQGSLHSVGGNYSGTGAIGLREFELEGYPIGRVRTQYSLSEKKARFSDFAIETAGGSIESESVGLEFTDSLPIASDLTLRGLKLDGILAALKSPGAPVRMDVDGKLKLTGTLAKPFRLTLEGGEQVKNFWVLDNAKGSLTRENSILHFEEGRISNKLVFHSDKMEVLGTVKALSGEAVIEGTVGFDNEVDLRSKITGLSLTELKEIAGLQFGGVADLGVQLTVDKRGTRVAGTLDVNGGEVAELNLGHVKGVAQYQDMLLSFSNLELKSTETIRGSGFVDFRPDKTHYRFDVDGRRMGMEQALAVFQKQKIPFPPPQGGEISARVSIEGGHDPLGIEVGVNGEARSFSWYGEKWISGSYSFVYRPDLVLIRKGVLLKKSGALEAKGRFDNKAQSLSLFSNGLRLEELDLIGKAPLAGEIQGRVVLEGDFQYPQGNGQLDFSKLTFRGNSIPDLHVGIQTIGENTEFLVKGGEDAFRAKLIRTEVKNGTPLSSLLLQFNKYDFIPLISLWLGKDIPPVADFKAAGEIKLEGDFSDWKTVVGKGVLNTVDLGFKGTPLKNRKPVDVTLSKGYVNLGAFQLVGSDSEINGVLSLQPGKSIEGRLDVRLDMQFIQPFIPGLDFGTGKVTGALRASGSLPNFDLFGNLSVEDGNFRLTGMNDEFQSAGLQLTISQERIDIDKFQALLGGGTVTAEGGVVIKRFTKFAPNLKLFVSRANLKLRNALTVLLTGDLAIRGEKAPYLMSGRVQVQEGRLSDFSMAPPTTTGATPALVFDIKAEAKDKMLVQTDVMDAEFKADLRVVGDSEQIGLLGSAETVKGSMIFKETRFNIETGTVKFEDAKRIFPRFNIGGRTVVREERANVRQDYEVNLQVLGTPSDYKIHLTSTPPLSEQDLIALLILGVTSRGQEGNYFDLGTTIVGQTPIQSKIQSELGVDIKVQSAPGQASRVSPLEAGTLGDASVPSVKIEKGITKKTKVSYSNTLESTPMREFKIEQMLNDSFTVNATAGDKGKNPTQTRPGDSFGLDFRYRFNFE